MYNNVSNEFKEAVKSNAVTSTAKITVYNSDDTTTLITGENIKTVKITDNCYNEGVIIGTTMAKEAEIEIINNNYDLADKEFDLELGIEISSGIFEYVPYGRYIVKSYEDTKSNNTYKIIAYDYMDKLNAKFEDTNAYPITLQEFYESLATQYNIEIETQELPNQDFNITEKPYFEGMSGRNVLSAIAQMFGSFAKFNRQNKVQMYLTNTTDEQITRSQMNSNLEIDKIYGPVNVVVLRLGQVEGENVTLRDEESIALYGETTLSIEDNPFVYSQALRELAIQGIYDRVKGFQYIPTTFNYKSPLYLDCGDTISVQLMNSDDYVSSIVLNQYIEVPSTRKSKCENKALTNTAIKHQFTPAEVVRNKRTEIMVDKQDQKITQLIEENTNQTNRINSVQSTLDGTITRVGKTETSIGNLETDVSELETGLGNAQKDISDLDTKLDEEVINLQAQIDGAIQFWNGEEIPTLNNLPASEWTTEEVRNNHRADIYTVIEDIDGELKQGKSYRFDKVGNTWTWVELTDNELSAVQALAQSKAKVFTTTPKPPYNVGDLWLKDKELYECITAKDANGTYAVADWQKATKYTDDTVAYLAQATADKAINNQTITATTEEGKEFYLTDSAENVCKTVEIFGESKQEIRSGKNIFDNTAKPVYSTGNNTVTKLDTGIRITSNANATESYSFAYYAVKDLTDYVGKKVRMKANMTASGQNTFRYIIGLGSKDGTTRNSKAYSSNSGVEISFVIPELEEGINYLGIWLYVNNGVSTVNVGDYVDYTDLIITIDNEDMTYEPYGAMPSPEFPSEIESVSGKNEFDVNSVLDMNTGTTHTIENNKIIIHNNGTGYGIYTDFTLKPNTTYTLSCKSIWNITRPSSSGWRISRGDTWENVSGKDVYTFTTDDNTEYRIVYYLGLPNTNVGTVELTNIQLEKGNKATFPVPYNHIGFKSVGKNNFDIDTFKSLNTYNTYETYNGVECLRLVGNTITYNFDGKENTQYTFQLKIIDKTANDIGMWQFVYSDGMTSDILYIGNVTGIKSVTSTANKTIKGIKWNAWSSGNIVYIDKNSMQLEEGTATEYEPYKESITTLPLLHPMRSLPNGTRDTIYYKDGKWYDEQRVDSIIFDGTQTIGGGHALGTGYRRITYRIPNCVGSWAKGYEKSNRFKVAVNDAYNARAEAFCVDALGLLYLSIAESRLSEISITGINEWFSENNTEVIYELAEPIITEIIDPEMINALESIRTFKNITHITADAPSILTYYRDVPMVEEYETIANANKKYQTTTEKFAEQEVTNSSIRSSVSQINTTITNDLATKTALSTEIAQVNNSVDIKIEETEAQIQEVDGKVETLSEKVNDMSYNFGTQGLRIATSQDSNNSLLDNTGIRVYNYSKLQAIFNYKGSGIDKLIVTGTAQIGYLRFLKSIKDGQKVTKIFHLEQLIENLEDLEV